MRSIHDVNDIELVKQANRLLEAENGRLHAMLAEMNAELATLKGQQPAEQLEIRTEQLQRQVNALLKMLFGAASERRPRTKPPSKPKPPASSAAREQELLEIVPVPHVLPDDARLCTSCGQPLIEWTGQHEESEEVDVIERRFVVKKHRRQKYRCRCGAAPVVAPGPVKLPGGGRYSLDFAISVAVAKFLDHLPWERQTRMMGRQGLHITSGTLWEQMERLARVLARTALAIGLYVKAAEVVHVDESKWQMLKRDAKLHWIWTFACHDAVYFQIEDTRAHDVVIEVLGRDFEGVMVSDDFSAYNAAGAKMRRCVRAGCWAHGRRGFTDIEEDRPEVGEVIDLIGRLFLIERDLPKWQDIRDPALRAQALAQIRAVRQEQSKPVCDEIMAWLKSRRELGGGPFGEAVKYLGLPDNWVLFTRFLDDPRIPLSNNLAERELRGPVLGRNNFLGCRSERGLEVAEVFYTLLQSARRARVHPGAYLRAAAEAALRGEEPLLPHVYRRQSSSV